MRALAVLLLLPACVPVERESENASWAPQDNFAEEMAEADNGTEAELDNGVVGATGEDRASEGEGSGLDLRTKRSGYMGKCAASDWSAFGGTREPLRCDLLQLFFVARSPGNADTVILLQQGSRKILQLDGIWSERERLKIGTATAGDGAPVPVMGTCTGCFDRPGEDYFAGNSFEFEVNLGQPKGARPVRYACDVRDGEGRPLAAFDFTAG